MQASREIYWAGQDALTSTFSPNGLLTNFFEDTPVAMDVICSSESILSGPSIEKYFARDVVLTPPSLTWFTSPEYAPHVIQFLEQLGYHTHDQYRLEQAMSTHHNSDLATLSTGDVATDPHVYTTEFSMWFKGRYPRCIQFGLARVNPLHAVLRQRRSECRQPPDTILTDAASYFSGLTGRGFFSLAPWEQMRTRRRYFTT